MDLFDRRRKELSVSLHLSKFWYLLSIGIWEKNLNCLFLQLLPNFWVQCVEPYRLNPLQQNNFDMIVGKIPVPRHLTNMIQLNSNISETSCLNCLKKRNNIFFCLVIILHYSQLLDVIFCVKLVKQACSLRQNCWYWRASLLFLPYIISTSIRKR